MSKQIGIVYSPGYGAGFSTWGHREMALDQELAQAIEDGASHSQQAYLVGKNWNRELLDPLEVMWVNEGTEFLIDEYDGYEGVQLKEDMRWQVAQ